MPTKKELSVYEFIPCRTLRHAWDEIPDPGGFGRAYENSRTVQRVCFRCTRCHMLRLEAWSPVTGSLLFRDYRQPDGYKLSGRVKMEVFRKEYLALAEER